MRIALCFSGQLRTWRKTITQFKKFISILEDKGHTVDVFCHMWNFNTYPNAIAASMQDFSPYVIVEQTEIKELISELNPKSFLVEQESSALSAQQSILNVTNKFILDTYGINYYGHFFAPQFYSVMRSAYLKRKYESDNNLVYDCCFRLRYDLWFIDDQLDYFFTKSHEFQQPMGGTIFSVHNSIQQDFPYYRTGDIFWFSNSDTFDRICDFYRWLKLLGPRVFGDYENPPIEGTFYFYLKFLNLNIKNLHADPSIARSDNYQYLRQQAGYDGVMSCDKI